MPLVYANHITYSTFDLFWVYDTFIICYGLFVILSEKTFKHDGMNKSSVLRKMWVIFLSLDAILFHIAFENFPYMKYKRPAEAN